jgi:hypothetical protein
MVPTEGFDIYVVCGPLYRCKPTLNGSYFAGRFIEKSDNIEQIGQGLPLSLSKSTRDAPDLGFTRQRRAMECPKTWLKEPAGVFKTKLDGYSQAVRCFVT